MESILKKPLITEKYNEIAEKLSQFAFVVDKRATKDEIKEQIEKVYNVEVEKVRTMLYRGKTKTRYTRKGFIEGKAANYKKAIVSLKEGDTIDFYDNL